MTSHKKLYIGTSGWNYDHWKPTFYRATPRKDWLTYYAGNFNSVEVNATFYRMMSSSTLTRWHDCVPKEFRFCVKGNRYLTHNLKLNRPNDALAKEKQNLQFLNTKLLAVLWQLPANVTKNTSKLTVFCQALQQWPGTRHVIEFRHSSWFDEQTKSVLQDHNVSNCISDAADWPLWEMVSSDLVYIRLHGHSKTYQSSYNAKSLNDWAQRIEQWLKQRKTVCCYFDNDANANAIKNALALQSQLR